MYLQTGHVGICIAETHLQNGHVSICTADMHLQAGYVGICTADTHLLNGRVGICTAYPHLPGIMFHRLAYTYMDWPITAPRAHYRQITPIDAPFCVYNNNRLTYYAMRID
jgi:hypothetical protein